ncbi:MAG: metallophosphoesterase [Methanoregula sp.]|nr:metallophosphoesterase [Methanoregula sp.]
MGTVVFSDVHADAEAMQAFAAFIRDPLFSKRFGPIDTLVNLGDILHRGNCPEKTLEIIHELSKEFTLVSILGNHDHAFLNGVPVSGSDEISARRHELLHGSPLLAIFDSMPLEWEQKGCLFVHGGPLDLGDQTLRLKCWQRLSHSTGDSFTGFHYTAAMAFETLEKRGLTHMICGHQHTHICCRKTADGIEQHAIRFRQDKHDREWKHPVHTARVALDVPTLFRVGACHGETPEFAYLDDRTFTYIRISGFSEEDLFSPVACP